MTNISRRDLLIASGTAAGAAFLPSSASAAPVDKAHKFEFSLNMSTIMGQKLGLIKELEVASAAGFQHCEIWVPTLEAYLKSGGTLSEAKKRIDDLGIQIQFARSNAAKVYQPSWPQPWRPQHCHSPFQYW